MNKTIHELNSLTQAQADDELIIYDVSEGESKKIQVQSLNNPNYSTTEQKTGGTWIDGKPIYRKVINTTSLANNTVLIQNVDTVINSGGTVGISSQMQPYPFPMSGYTKHWELTSTGDLKYRCDSTTSIVKIWFEYTKTTD